MKIIEATGPNINLLIELADIFMTFYDNNYKSWFEDKLKKDMLSGIYGMGNPFRYAENRIRKFTDNQNIIDEIMALEFSLDTKGYSFKDDDKTQNAAATYHPVTKTIVFYHPRFINKNVLVHELRHAIQFAEYERKRKQQPKDKTRNYRDMPIEIDAYWSEKFYDNIQFGIPDTKERLLGTAKNIIRQLKKDIPRLSEKKTKHYYRKTLAGLIDLKKLYHLGYEDEIQSLQDFKKIINDDAYRQQLIDRLVQSEDDNDFENSRKNLEKFDDSRKAFFETIPGYDISKEPSYSITDLQPPTTLLPRDMELFGLQAAMIYLVIKDRIDIAEKFYEAIRKTPKHENVDMHDIIVKASELSKDEDNQLAIQQLMVSKLRDLF